MISEAADHMSCPLHAWHCIYWLACAAACTQNDRTGACGGARPVSEHRTDQPLISGLSCTSDEGILVCSMP